MPSTGTEVGHYFVEGEADVRGDELCWEGPWGTSVYKFCIRTCDGVSRTPFGMPSDTNLPSVPLSEDQVNRFASDR